MKALSELLKAVKPLTVEGSCDVEIAGVEIDSRKVKQGDLFVAMKGTQVDGHRFIGKAIGQGAVAVLCEDMPQEKAEGVTYIQVASTEEAVGPVATHFFGDPSRQLKLVGVTGTNGKTTIATLLYNLFRKLGHKVGLLSTVCNYIDGEAVPADHTTPDPIALNELLARMVSAGCTYCFMECSSHAIHQHRIGGLHFAGGLFTNLTRDHLDYHKTFENYRNAKKMFFDMLPKTAFAVTNADDKNGLFMVQNCKASVKTYSIQRVADYRARILECHFEGMYLEIDGKEVGVQFIGRFNVSNLLAVYAAAVLLGEDAQAVLVAMSTLGSVSGRLEPIRSPEGFTAIVDYAHTPDGLENICKTMKKCTEGRLVTVFGCGGDRDKGKRPQMGAIAAALSDFMVITSDNPRTEEPEGIIQDILEGIKGSKTPYKVIENRPEAIRWAVLHARPGDTVLLAGKGHETYQILKSGIIHLDEREVVAEALQESGD